jgi:hypothetical protein
VHVAKRLTPHDVMNLLEGVACDLGLQPAQRWELGRLEMDHPIDEATAEPLPDPKRRDAIRIRIRRAIWIPADAVERDALAVAATAAPELALLGDSLAGGGLVVDHTTPLLRGPAAIEAGFRAALATVGERALAGMAAARSAVHAVASDIAPARAALLHTLLTLTDPRVQTVGHALRLRLVGVDSFGLDILPDRYPVLLWLHGDELRLATLPFGCPSGRERARLEVLLGPVAVATRANDDFQLGAIDVDAALWPAFMTTHASSVRDAALAETIWSHAEIGRAIAAVQTTPAPAPSFCLRPRYDDAPATLRA